MSRAWSLMSFSQLSRKFATAVLLASVATDYTEMRQGIVSYTTHAEGKLRGISFVGMFRRSLKRHLLRKTNLTA